METSLHYAVYRPIITALQAMGHTCSLLVSDKIHASFLDEMTATIKTINDPLLGGTRLSVVIEKRQRFKCLVSPYYTPLLNGLADTHVRTMYGLAKKHGIMPGGMPFIIAFSATATIASTRLILAAAPKWWVIPVSMNGITILTIPHCQKA
jgi:hypothetical protein